MASILALKDYCSSNESSESDDEKCSQLPVVPFSTMKVNENMALPVVAAPDVLPNVSGLLIVTRLFLCNRIVKGGVFACFRRNWIR